MALANVRERLALHFDAEASLESRVTKDSYEVHIRIPYRTAVIETSLVAPTVTGPLPGQEAPRDRNSIDRSPNGASEPSFDGTARLAARGAAHG